MKDNFLYVTTLCFYLFAMFNDVTNKFLHRNTYKKLNIYYNFMNLYIIY